MTAGTAEGPRGLRRDIQGLRALAIVAVVLYHAGVPFLPGGYVGVDVFFVISGFLITGLLWRELAASRRISFARFYARRIARLLPSAALVLVATVGAAALLLPPLRLPSVAKDALSAALYGSNYRFAWLQTDYLSDKAPSPIQHYWSLGVEEQFYLLWPLLLLVAASAWRRRTGRHPATAPLVVIAAVAVASFVLCVHLTTVSQPWAFYSLPTRAWELAVGALLALSAPALARLPRQGAVLLGVAGLTAIVVAVVAFGSGTPFPGFAAALPVAGSAAVLAAGVGSRTSPVARLLSLPLARRLGDVSYTWYLWHWPVLVLGATRADGPVARTLYVLLSLGLAVVTSRLVENPLRRRLAADVERRGLAGRGFAPRRGLAFGGVVTVVVALVCVAAIALPRTSGSGRPAAAPSLGVRPVGARATGPLPDLNAAERPLLAALPAAVATQQVPSNLQPSLGAAHADKAQPFLDGCDLSFRTSTSPPCSYGDAASSTRIVAFGDSHAAQWFPALEAVAQQHSWRLESLTKATCPPMDIPIFSPVLGREFTECEQWRAATLARIFRERPAVVIVDVARHYGPEYRFAVGSPQWAAALHALVATLSQHGTRVLVLGATERPPGDVPDCLSAHLDSVSDCAPPRAEAVVPTTAAAERAAVQTGGGTFVDVAPWMCTAERCAAIVGNVLVLRDDNHVTTAYARLLAPVFDAMFTDVLRSPPGSPR